MRSAAVSLMPRRSWLGELLALFRRVFFLGTPPALPALPSHRRLQDEDEDEDDNPTTERPRPEEHVTCPGRSRDTGRRPRAELLAANPLEDTLSAPLPSGPAPLPELELSGPKLAQPAGLLLAPSFLETCARMALLDAAAARKGDPGGARRYNQRLRTLAEHVERAVKVAP